MHLIVAFAQAVGTKVTVWLVGHGAPYVIAATLALAGIGAAITNPPPASAPQTTVQASTPSISVQPAHHCDHDGDGGSGSYYGGY
jgi:hypothetical protein